MTYLELLSPAKNLECGIAAVDHGCDAVYIGATQFGARASAGNSLEDIQRLVDYAHTFNVKVYVTVNTIIYEDELKDTERLIWDLYNINVDAILVQDMAILKMNLPPIALHASTQTDNRTAEKVKMLKDAGFKRTVLARELSADEIRDIHRQVPDMPLEVFVHGALCVSYSGQCYASQYCFNRSANRGECAQFCRLPYDLVDSLGHVLVQGKHMLSLKDMCQLDSLEMLIKSGATSFKIEGRLKDVDYVKNITAAYSKALNEVIKHHPDRYARASWGHCEYSFEPNVNKTFNRGYTSYFLHGRQQNIASFDTPKSIGEYVGKVKEIKGNTLKVSSVCNFNNGDGLCFFDEGQLYGFRVNKVENNRLFPHQMPKNLRAGMSIYRNNDTAFSKILSGDSSVRKMAVDYDINVDENGLSLTATLVEDKTKTSTVLLNSPIQKAEKPQKENVLRILGKLGNTPFVMNKVTSNHDTYDFFIPSAQLTQLRRDVLSALMDSILYREKSEATESPKAEKDIPPTIGHLTYEANVSNSLSRRFYLEQGFSADDAFELREPRVKRIMQCRHCIRYALGYCKRTDAGNKLRDPLYLVSSDDSRKRFELKFDCKNCQMDIYAI